MSKVRFESSYSSLSVLISDQQIHFVAIPLGNLDRPISIRLTNMGTTTVQLYASLCSPQAAPILLWNKKLTVANIKFTKKHYHELEHLAVLESVKCNSTAMKTLFFSIRSKNARGKIIVDKALNEFCDGKTCTSWGTMRFFKNTTGLIIAQCKFLYKTLLIGFLKLSFPSELFFLFQNFTLHFCVLPNLVFQTSIPLTIIHNLI